MTHPAVLRYAAIGAADKLVERMEEAAFEFKAIHAFLTTALDYMERDERITRLEWSMPDDDDLQAIDASSRDSSVAWVRLHAADGTGDDDVGTFIEGDERFVHEEGTGTNARGRRTRGTRLEVVDRFAQHGLVALERTPSTAILEVWPFTLPLRRSLSALQDLRNRPHPAHEPLLRLVGSPDAGNWPRVDVDAVNCEWQVLLDESRPGTAEQRRFVRTALATPDFALLEGPPGSGKTTAILELVGQLVERGQRVLLCGNTHVAVDNVLERLVDPTSKVSDYVTPLRIGHRTSVAEAVRPYLFQERVRTERNHLVQHLSSLEAPTLAQEALLRDLRNRKAGRIEQLVLEVANVVGGTVLGVLQHPDIKAALKDGDPEPIFDVLIIDEASKTPFTDFLVPAMLAKRWVLVGDRRQLSPSVDAEHLEAQLRPIAKGHIHEATRGLLVLRLLRGDVRRVFVNSSDEALDDLVELVENLGLNPERRDLGEAPTSAAGLVVIGEGTPHDLSEDDVLASTTPPAAVESEWSREVAWRLATEFELRLMASDVSGRLGDELVALLGDPHSQLAQSVHRMGRTALPSVLESLQCGIAQRNRGRRTVLSEGLPPEVLASRFQRLTYQHRMHPDISRYSRSWVYEDEALNDPPDMADHRRWGYGRYASRAQWLDVAPMGTSGVGEQEASIVVDEVVAFTRWADRHPRQDGRPWSVAVLTFYRAQEATIRRGLRSATQGSGYSRFVVGTGQTEVTLKTVDSFQGYEADVVFLSIGKGHLTHFTRSPNRVNVAITRARYQLVVVGHRQGMRRGLLADLAKSVPHSLSWSRGDG